MEYLDGENLSDVIARGAVPVELAVSVAIELCAFLEAAHSFEAVIGDRKLRSLVHGDLKPQNVRITSDGSVKVLDFGIAKALSLSRKVTRNDFGTTPYLSPERLDGDVNEFADLWAVGVMLHEMIRGKRPFDAPDTRRLERLIRARLPPQPLAGRCPVGLEAIVGKLLGPSAAVRYANARAVREDLERFRSGARTTAEEQGWPERVLDQEATRRTGPASVADDEATRRTRPSASAVGYGGTRGGSPSAPAPGESRAFVPRAPTGRRRKVLVLAAASILLFGLTANECSVASDARKVAAGVSTRELDQLGAAWTAYESLAERSHLRFGTMRLERSLTARTLELADRVIANYRMALPTVREAQWQSARDALARAMLIAPDNHQLRAAFRYCDGHLHRINGEADKTRHQDVAAQRELTEAVAAFREAADLRPEWPDPFLGLARTFIYGLEDIDRGADALNQAQRRGYAPTDRETGQLADGYRTRGNSLVRSARELSGMPQESDYLTRAVEGYRTRPRPVYAGHQPGHLSDEHPYDPACARSGATAARRDHTRYDGTCRADARGADPPGARLASQRAGTAGGRCTMAVTYVTASDRDAWLTVAGARRLDVRHGLLAVTSLVAVLAITLAYQGRVAADAADAPREGVTIDLNAVENSAQLDRWLRPVYAESRDRQIAATQLYEFIAARRDRGDSLPNVGAVRPLLSSEQLAALKPFAVVRTAQTHEQHVVVWGAVYVSCVWIVSLLWWFRGIRGITCFYPRHIC